MYNLQMYFKDRSAWLALIPVHKMLFPSTLHFGPRKPLRFAVPFLVLQATSTLSGEVQKRGLYVFAQTRSNKYITLILFIPIPSWDICNMYTIQWWTLTYLFVANVLYSKTPKWMLPFQHTEGQRSVGKTHDPGETLSTFAPHCEKYGSDHSS